MTINELLVSAGKIDIPSEAAAGEYGEKMDLMISMVNRDMLARPDLSDLTGDASPEMIKNNSRNHASFIYSIMLAFNPEALVNTVLWVYRSYRSRGFSTEFWPVYLNIWIEVMKKTLDEGTFTEILPLYRWLTDRGDDFASLTDGATGDNQSDI